MDGKDQVPVLCIPLDWFMKDQVKDGLAIATQFQHLWEGESLLEEDTAQPRLGKDTCQFAVLSILILGKARVRRLKRHLVLGDVVSKLYQGCTN